VLSLKIAVISATMATILGTMAGIALARFTKFRGRVLFSGWSPRPDHARGDHRHLAR
jgi:putrescine transport system permease protein